MSAERIQMDSADQADFLRFRDYLRRIFGKYGPDVLADAYSELIKEGNQHATGALRESCCSFCGKMKSELANRMIAGPGVFICIRCIDICYNVRRQQWPDDK
jgi:hypothetical protein